MAAGHDGAVRRAPSCAPPLSAARGARQLSPSAVVFMRGGQRAARGRAPATAPASLCHIAMLRRRPAALGGRRHWPGCVAAAGGRKGAVESHRRRRRRQGAGEDRARESSGTVAEAFHAREGCEARGAGGVLIRFCACQIIRRLSKPLQRHHVVLRAR